MDDEVADAAYASASPGARTFDATGGDRWSSGSEGIDLHVRTGSRQATFDIDDVGSWRNLAIGNPSDDTAEPDAGDSVHLTEAGFEFGLRVLR